MQRKKGQKYQNKKAFEIKFDTKALQDHKKIKLNHLCKRCVQQIQWKIQFNKYKRQSEPSKCNFCSLKVVVRSYHQVCDPCAIDKNVCSKCMKSNDEVDQPSEVPVLNKKDKEGAETKQEQRMNFYLKELRERSKRKVMREYEKGNYQWDDEGRRFLDKDGNEIEQLKFKVSKEGDFGDDLDLDDDDEIEEEQEILEQDEKQEKRKTKQQKQKVSKKNQDGNVDQQKQQKQQKEENQSEQDGDDDFQDDDEDFEDDDD